MMKHGRRMVRVTAAAAMLLAALAAGAPAQPERAAPAYDPRTEETVSGVVVKLEPATLTGKPEPVYLTLKADRETLLVFVAPNWFLADQEMKLGILDRVTITGSRVSFRGTAGLIARRVQKGEQTLELRDAAGKGRWGAGGGKKTGD